MQTYTAKLSIKSLEDNGTFEGHAAVYGNRDLVGDIIQPGACKKTLAENRNLPVLWQHDPTEPIGVVEEAQEDAKGLYVKASLNLETQRGREAYALIRQGAIKGLSIGYSVILEDWDKATRIIKELRLYEISPVTFAANPKAKVEAIKSLDPNKINTAIAALQALLSPDTNPQEPADATSTGDQDGGQEGVTKDSPEEPQNKQDDSTNIELGTKLAELRDILRGV